MITGLAHINLLVPEGSLPEANEFYVQTLGLTARPVPQAQVETTAWYDILSFILFSPLCKNFEINTAITGSTSQEVPSKYISHSG